LADVDPTWPLVMDIGGSFYFEPESGGLLVSPADETPSQPGDARAEEIDVALALDRVREATTLPLRSVRTAWAGLRTFSPDSAPVVGEEPSAPGFYWLVGQGGGGIKTAPALAQALVAAVFDEPMPGALAGRGISLDDLSPQRFR
jgi:D-arginine dehydrogenase